MAFLNDGVTHKSENHIFGGDLHLCVEGVPFCVHSYFLERDSQYWKRRLSDAHFPRAPGSEPANPIILNEDPDDFAHFLWVFYNPYYSVYEASCSDWLAILRLATKWECPDIQDFALSYLKKIPMDPWQRIAIFQKYDVPFVDQLPILVELASSDNPTKKPEISEATFTRIERAHARFLEIAVSQGSPPGTICETLSYEERSAVIAQEFGLVPDTESTNMESDAEAPYSDNHSVITTVTKTWRAGEIPTVPEAISDWEMIPASGASAPTENYIRFPIMVHDFVVPYCLVLSFICALIA